VGTIILGINGSPLVSRSNQIVAQADTTINAKKQGLNGNSKAINNDNLKRILNKWKHGKVTIRIPKGNYLFNSGNIKLHSNIIFKFDKGAKFQVNSGNSVIFVYPSPKKGYNGGISNVAWENATFSGNSTSLGQSSFIQSVHHAKNITFSNCTFNNAEPPAGHYIDLDGSHNIKITNSTFRGFDGAVDYKEAIQIDYSNPVAMSYRNPSDKYDNLPTYNVVVNNNRFLPIYKKTGQIISYAPNPIGEHAVYDNGQAGIIHDVHFSNNLVIDPIPLPEYNFANIRFVDVSNLWITNNRFVNQRASSSSNYIYLNNVVPTYNMTNLNIKNNSFTNVTPSKQYIFLNDINQNNPMKKISITGNTIVNKNISIPFVGENFPVTSSDLIITNNSFKE